MFNGQKLFQSKLKWSLVLIFGLALMFGLYPSPIVSASSHEEVLACGVDGGIWDESSGTCKGATTENDQVEEVVQTDTDTSTESTDNPQPDIPAAGQNQNMIILFFSIGVGLSVSLIGLWYNFKRANMHLEDIE